MELIHNHDDRKNARKCNQCKLNAYRDSACYDELLENLKKLVKENPYVYSTRDDVSPEFLRLFGNTREKIEMWNKPYGYKRALQALEKFIKADTLERKKTWAIMVKKYLPDAPEANVAFWLGVCSSIFYRRRK
jgi:hypothetical protein